MHEMSIALHVIDLALEQAGKAGATRVVEVDLDIGTLSGVETSQLEQAIRIASADTLMESAAIRIHPIRAVSECTGCGWTFDAGNHFCRCPACGRPDARIIQGREMQVRSLLVE